MLREEKVISREKLQNIIQEAVASLNGRFREYVSDAFLAGLIHKELGNFEYYNDQNNIYAVCAYIFGVLEFQCKALLCSHTVAQQITAFITQKIETAT